jgi:CHASE3 domain sensor protein
MRNRGLLTGFAMVFATLLVTAALGYLNVRRLSEHNQLIEHTREVVSELRNLLGLVADAESGVRGFVVAADEAYLRPYFIAKVTVADTVDRIQRLTEDNAPQQVLGADLKSMCRS